MPALRAWRKHALHGSSKAIERQGCGRIKDFLGVLVARVAVDTEVVGAWQDALGDLAPVLVKDGTVSGHLFLTPDDVISARVGHGLAPQQLLDAGLWRGQIALLASQDVSCAAFATGHDVLGLLRLASIVDRRCRCWSRWRGRSRWSFRSLKKCAHCFTP